MKKSEYENEMKLFIVKSKIKELEDYVNLHDFHNKNLQNKEKKKGAKK